MFIWRIDELKSKLATAPLTDREALPYLLIFVGVTGLLPLFPPTEMNHWDYLSAGFSLLVALGGTLYVYARNGGNSGRYFLQRYFAIGWVTTVRWLAIVVPLFFALMFGLDWESHTTPYETVYFAVAEIFLFARIGYHVLDVAKLTVAI